MAAYHTLLEVTIFVVLRLRGRSDATIPKALWLHTGSVLSAVAQIILRPVPFALLHRLCYDRVS